MPSKLIDNDFFIDFDSTAIYNSDGEPLTSGQANFFKDSKCVDENGSLYKVYQASNSDFDAFDKSFIGSGAGYIYGKGFYFGADPDSVKIYGSKINEYYLRLKNPYRYEAVDDEDDALYNVDTFVELLEQNGFKVSEELQLDLETDVLENDGGLDTLIELTCGSDRVAEFFKSSGYDGIMNLDVLDFVAFEPNQIKLCSNKAPTSSEKLVASYDYK